MGLLERGAYWRGGLIREGGLLERGDLIELLRYLSSHFLAFMQETGQTVFACLNLFK